jgi:hypothetical protein
MEMSRNARHFRLYSDDSDMDCDDLKPVLPFETLDDKIISAC